jgi:hypothetical protein
LGDIPWPSTNRTTQETGGIKFTWNGEPVRESTKQTNKRVAEQMEAAHRTALAKGEVGIRKREPAPTLTQFIESEFSPFIEGRFTKKPKTLEYYRNGIKNLQAYGPLAKSKLDTLAASAVTGFTDERHATELEVSPSTDNSKCYAAFCVLRSSGAKSKRLRLRSPCCQGRTSGTAS